MPSPVGHALGGLATAWLFEGIADRRKALQFDRRQRHLLLLACAGAAVAPDLDIPFHMHRMYTHSIGAALVVFAAVWIAGRWSQHRAGDHDAASRSQSLFIAVVVSLAYTSHILLDWLGKDSSVPGGLTALWPFSSRYYISGANLFLEVSRRYWKPDEFIYGNLRAAIWEVILLGPIAAIAWKLRRFNR